MPLGQRGGRVAKRSRPKVLTVPLTRQGGAPPVQQRALGDRAGMGRPLPQGLAVALPGPADVAQRDGGKGISSTESTSICAGPAQYRPPGRTLGRRHSRKDTGDVARQHRFPQIPAELHQPVLRLRPGAPAPPGRSPVPAFPRGAASLHPHLSGRRRDRSVVALTDQTPPAQRQHA